MRPIKWKGIRSGLRICCQKISQTNLQSYSCIMKLKIVNFWLFFKMRSRDDFPKDSSWFVPLWPTKKCRKTRSDIILVPNLLWESSDRQRSYDRLASSYADRLYRASWFPGVNLRFDMICQFDHQIFQNLTTSVKIRLLNYQL